MNNKKKSLFKTFLDSMTIKKSLGHLKAFGTFTNARNMSGARAASGEKRTIRDDIEFGQEGLHKK